MKRLFLTIATMAVLAANVAVPAVARADYGVFNQACSSNSGAAACSAQGNTSNPIGGPTGVIHKVTLIVARFAGVIAVIVVIYGGFKLVIGGDDPSKVKEARQTIIYALVGVVIIVIGQTIIIFVVDRV